MPVQSGLKATLIVLVLALWGRAAPGWTAGSGAAADGRTLQSELKALQAEGLNLVFSNALVKPHLLVSQRIDRTAPLPDRAAALLEPFGLALENAAPDVWYVVQAQAQPVAEPRPVVPARAPLLEEVLVTSSRYRLVRDTHERRRLESHDLDVVPSMGSDLLRALNHLPGQASVGISARSHMRGGNSNEVLYLIDGIEIIEPFHMGDFHALFSAINPGLVDAINVYHAGFPAAFGSRLSGVVDMELAQPEQPMEGRVNVDFVSASTHAQGNTGEAQWLVSARRSTVDYLLDYLERDYGRPTFHDELVRMAWQGDSTDLSVGMLFGNDKLSLEDGSAGEAAFANYDNALAWIRASHAISEALEVRVAGSFTTVDNQRWGSLHNPVDAVGSLRESRNFQVFTLRGGLRWQPADGWVVDAGLEGQRQTGEFEVDIDTRYGMLGDPLQPVERLLRDISSNRDGTLLTAFVSSQQKIGEHWSIEYGARYDLQDIDPVYDQQFSPRVQLAFDGGGGWRAYLNAGRYAQHQNLYELQLDDGLLELHAPQIADQVSVGSDWTFMPWRLRVEAYWREIDDPWSRFENLYNHWVLLPELHADRVSLVPEKARTFGGEMSLERRVSENLRWSLSWAVARAEERFAGRWRPRPWEQRRTLRANLDWRPAQWRIGLSAAHHAGWPTTSLITEPVVGFERLYDDQLPDFFSLDLHATRRFELPRSALEVYLELSNLTFAENIGGYRYELEGQRLVGDERRLLPAVPVLGLSWLW